MVRQQLERELLVGQQLVDGELGLAAPRQVLRGLVLALHSGHGARTVQPGLPADTLKGAIRLSFAAWRLSLPFSTQSSAALDDKKIA